MRMYTAPPRSSSSRTWPSTSLKEALKSYCLKDARCDVSTPSCWSIIFYKNLLKVRRRDMTLYDRGLVLSFSGHFRSATTKNNRIDTGLQMGWPWQNRIFYCAGNKSKSCHRYNIKILPPMWYTLELIIRFDDPVVNVSSGVSFTMMNIYEVERALHHDSESFDFCWNSTSYGWNAKPP